MMKKFLAVVTAAVLALGCMATVSAKDLEHSIKEELGDDLETILITDFEGLVGKSLNGKDYKLQAFLDGAAADDDAVKVAYSHLRAQAKVTAGKIEKMFKIVCKDADEDEPAEIIIPYDKAKAGKGYTVWRYDAKSGIWDATSVKVTKVENGKLYAAVKKDGNVALVKGGTTTNAGTDAKAAGAAATTGKAAPKTGEV